MNLLLNRSEHETTGNAWFSRQPHGKTCELPRCWDTFRDTPVHDAQRGLPLLDEAHSAVAVPLVLNGDTADLNHHIPQLLGCTPALFGTWKLLTRGRQELANL